MQFRRYSFLLGALVLSSLSANAQYAAPGHASQPSYEETGQPGHGGLAANHPAGHAAGHGNLGTAGYASKPLTNGRTPSRTYTSVDAYGNVTRTTVQTPLAGATSVPGLIANQAILGANTTTSSSVYLGNNGASFSSHYYPGYYPPAYYPPAYPPAYPYPNVSNNYYYPAAPYTMPLKPKFYDWEHPATITVAPIGGYYGAPAPVYPYPYPTYPAPYPYPNYGYPYGGTTTVITGTGQGSISNRSSSSGFGLSIGKGGVTGRVSSRNSSSSTVVTAR